MKFFHFKRERTEQEVILSIRLNLLAMGFDLSEFSDEELAKGVKQLGAIGLRASLSVEEAGQALSHMAKAMSI